MAEHNAPECTFCAIACRGDALLWSELAYAVRDSSPVTPLHTLILPKRHAPTYFDLSAEERLDVDQLLFRAREQILELDPTVEGFNIGINVGATAGQTIFHCHVHLIPRRQGDVADPRGGVRSVIPGKADY